MEETEANVKFEFSLFEGFVEVVRLETKTSDRFLSVQ